MTLWQLAKQHCSPVIDISDPPTREPSTQNARPNQANEQTNSQQPKAEELTSEDAEAERTQKRAWVKKGKHVLTPTKSKLRCHLTFQGDLEKEWNGKLCKLSIVLGKCIHHTILENLKIRTGILTLIYAIGWGSYFEVYVLAYVEIVKECYITF